MKVSAPIIIAIVIIPLFCQACSSSLYDTEDIKMQKIEKSSHYKDGKFLNYKGKFEIEFWDRLSIMWEMIITDNDRKPDVELPSEKVDLDKIKNAKNDELKITWVGHSSQIINIDGKIILTDPVFENRVVFMGPSRYNGDVPMEIADLPDIDIVIISHNHFDHLNIPTIEKINNKVKYFITPLMVGAELEAAGVPRSKIIELDWWEEINLFEDFLFVLTPAQHYTGRGLGDGDATLWGSYVIKGPHHKIYFSGDSGYFEGFKQIGDKYGPFDYTLIECGAYNERWLYVHMLPEETIQAHLDLKGKILQPMHWGTFDQALHSWYDPMVRAARTADSLGIKLSTPVVGETITVSDSLKTKRWWEKLVPKKLNTDELSNND